MKKKNLAWLRLGVGRKINFNIGQPDEDFDGTDDDAYDAIDEALNSAYDWVVNRIMTEIDPDLLRVYDDIEWPSGQLRLTFPEHLWNVPMERVDDITGGDPGEPLYIASSEPFYTPVQFQASSNTLQWGASGAPGARTLRVFYSAQASEMKEPVDEPWIIPPRFRRILIQQAIVFLREDAEDEAPRSWYARVDDLWNTMILAMSEGRPSTTNRARIRVLDGTTTLF